MIVNPLYKIQIESIKKDSIKLIEYINLRKEKISNINEEIVHITNVNMLNIKNDISLSNVEKVSKIENEIKQINLKSDKINTLFKEIEQEVNKINSIKNDLFNKINKEHKITQKEFFKFFL